MKRSIIVWILLLGTAFLLTASPVLANYPLFHYDEQRTGNVSGNTPQTNRILWSTYLGGLVDSSPVVSNGRIFVSNWFAEWYGGVNGLYCLNETTGEIIWNNSLGGSGGASTAVISGEGDKLFVGSLDGNLYCIDASSGTTTWNKRIEHSPAYWGVASSPLVYENMILVTTFSNNASNNGTLHVFDFSGSELWNVSTGDTFYYTSPAVANGNVFFAGNLTNHTLYCVNISTHNIIWQFNTSTQIKSTPAIWNNTVFFASEDRRYAVNIITGNELWNNSFSCLMSSPAVSNGKVYIGSSNSRLHCYNADDGSEVWNTLVNGPIYSSPVVANDTVYFGTNTANGTKYALNTADGTLIWSYSLNPPSGSYYNIMSSPAVSDGILFIGADDGRVYAFGDKPAITAKIRMEGKNETIWSGEVTLSNSTIIDTNGTSHYIPYPSVLGALDEASNKGNFDYEVVYYPEYDALNVTSIANDSDWWHYWINYTLPSLGADKYELKEGDSVLWGYSESWMPSPLKITLDKTSVKVNEQFTATVESYNDTSGLWDLVDNATVHVDGSNYTTNSNGSAVISMSSVGSYTVYAEKERYIRSEKKSVTVSQNGHGGGGNGGLLYDRSVTFTPGTFTVIAVNSGESYSVDRCTVLGAIDATRIPYSVSDEWWASTDPHALFVVSLAGKQYPEGYWWFELNGKDLEVGANAQEVKNGDIVTCYWNFHGTATPLIRIKVYISSGGGGDSISPTPTPTPTPAPTEIAKENKTIEFIEAGGNASLTFNKTEITRIVINANNTIRNAEISVEQLEKTANITNVSGIPYCYFNVTTTNLTDTNITSATIEFKVNKTWINDRKVDEATIMLNKYSDINNNWSALPTSKIKEDNASLYFASETSGFSLFAVSGEKRTAHLARAEPEAEIEAETETPMPGATAAPGPTPTSEPIPTPASILRIPMYLIVIVIAVIGIAGMIIVVLSRK